MKTSLYPQAVLVACLSLVSTAWAQAIDPWLADGINRANEAARQHNARELQKMRARAWEARERKVQAEIAKHRATPYYYAIAYDFSNNHILGGGITLREER